MGERREGEGEAGGVSGEWRKDPVDGMDGWTSTDYQDC